jgi:hypothetical protein
LDNITKREAVILAAMTRHNISLDPKVYEEFCHYAGLKGIKISTWVNIKMKEFIEDEKELEEMNKKRKEGTR